ncbi:MAG: hypothetical protein WEC75_06525 [Dehalococcoidia bacterium]
MLSALFGLNAGAIAAGASRALAGPSTPAAVSAAPAPPPFAAGLPGWQDRALLGRPFAPGERNVLVLHGWNGSPWDGCMLRLAEALAARYDNVLAYAYPSALDIESNATWLRDAIAERYPGVTFDVVAFSEGGLVARTAIEPGEWNGGRTIASHVRTLVTIGTPHDGLLADLPPSWLGDIASLQMRPGSTFLRELNAAPRPGNVRYALIAGDTGHGSDGIVPVESALARTTLTPAATAVLPLPHTASPTTPHLPCDPAVYAAIDRVTP